MRHVLVSVLLLLAATCARADWVKVGENDGAVIYVDPATLGDTRRCSQDLDAQRREVVTRRQCRLVSHS
jgi:hypothetical protein